MPTPKNHSKSTLKVIHPPTMTRAEDWKRWIIPNAVWNKWKSLGLDDDDLNALQICVMMDPKGSPVIPGSGGLRKVRFVRRGQGKQRGDGHGRQEEQGDSRGNHFRRRSAPRA